MLPASEVAIISLAPATPGAKDTRLPFTESPVERGWWLAFRGRGGGREAMSGLRWCCELAAAYGLEGVGGTTTCGSPRGSTQSRRSCITPLPCHPRMGGSAMEVVYPRCCGLDLHKHSVTACRLVPGPD